MNIPHKKKFFIKSQIPQYIREEYPLFLELMEQYYSFLDSEEGQIIAVKVTDGGSGYNPVSPWAGNTSYAKGERFSFNNKVYSVVQAATSSSNSSGISNTFLLSAVNGSANSITFTSNHGFYTGDEINYSFNGATGPAGASGIIGLTDGLPYSVRVTNATTVKMYSNRSGALDGGASGLIDLASVGPVGISGLTNTIPGVSNYMIPGSTGLVFSGGDGSGAAGTATLTGNAGATGVTITTVTLTNAGSGYTTLPTVSIAGASGFTTNFSITPRATFSQIHKFTTGPWYSGATGLSTFANITSKYVSSGGPESVIVYFVTKNDEGVYINDPRTGSAAGAVAVPILDSGVVRKIVVTNPGSGYTKQEEPKAIVTGGGGSGAVLETVNTTVFNGLNTSVIASQNSRDIDETVEKCIESLKRELLPDIPDRLYLESDNLVESRQVDVRKLIKFIKQFYNSKGAEKSIQFLFRILFDSDVQIYYPKTDMLRVSDGKWSEDFIIRVSSTNTQETEESFTESFLGERIIGLDSGATATIQSVTDVAIASGGLTLELRLNEINGIFNTDEPISLLNFDRTITPTVIANIRPCISSLNIIDGGINYSKDDQILTDSSFLARVTETGTVKNEPKYFDISNDFSDVSKSFSIASNVNSTSETITFNTPHNYFNGDTLVYSMNTKIDIIGNNVSGNTVTIAPFNVVDDVDALNDCIILNTSHNYTAGDTVIYSFNGATGPAGATGAIGLNDDKIYYVLNSFTKDTNIVAEIDVVNSGSGYSSAPSIIFPDPYTGSTSFTAGTNIGATGFGTDIQIKVFDSPKTKFYKSYAPVPHLTDVPTHTVGATGYWSFIGRTALGTATIGLVTIGSTGATGIVSITVTDGGDGYSAKARKPTLTIPDPHTGATTFINDYPATITMKVGIDIPASEILASTGETANQFLSRAIASQSNPLNIGSTGFSSAVTIKVIDGTSTKFYKSTSVVPDSTNIPTHTVGATGYWSFIGNSPNTTVKMYSDIRGRYLRLSDSDPSNIASGSTGIINLSQASISQNHLLYLTRIGLTDNRTYFGRITGATGVQLYKTYAGAIAGSTGLLVNLLSSNKSEKHSLTKASGLALVDPSSDTITFNTPHNFKTGRGLIYSFNGSYTGATGSTGPLNLVDGETYYARITGATGVQLFSTFAGAMAGSTGLLMQLGATGIHQVHSFTQVSANSITKYKINNFGFNYQSQPPFTTNGGEGAVITGNFSGLLKYDGEYIGTDSQPSSSKKIQDSEYYQDFSYEIISDQSARLFGTILEKTIHPAGLRYFSKILSVKDESLYAERDNYNTSYEQYTIFVTNELGQTEFNIASLLNNGTEWTANDIVTVGTLANPTKIYLRIGSEDYIFIVSGSGTFGSTPPSITSGEQTNGTAKLIFSGIADKVLSVFVNGVYQKYGVDAINFDFTMQDANTIEFTTALPAGSIVRIYRREDIVFETEYQEYIQSFTTVLTKRTKFVRDSFDAYRWYPGLETTPKLWKQTGATSFLQNDIVVWNNNYYLVTQAGDPGKYPPTHVERSYPNGTTIMRYYPPFNGYSGDILFNESNFYKITGNLSGSVSGEFGSTGPVHTIGVSGVSISNSGISNYMSPGSYPLSFTGATGTGAAGNATLLFGATGVHISSVQITNGGNGYTIVPTIGLTGASGFTTNFSITAITGPAQALNGKNTLTYYDPGYSFWTGSTGVAVGNIVKHEGNWYKVIAGATTPGTTATGASGPSHNMGSQLSGTARLEYYPIDHAKTTILPVVSELDPGKAMLGPTVNDIIRNIGTGIPDFFQTILGSVSVTASTSYSTLDLGETGLSNLNDEYTGYTIIITFPDTTKVIRTITDYVGETKTVTFNSPISTGANTVALSYRLIQNYLIDSVVPGTFSVPDPGATGLKIGLSQYDLAYILNPLTGATGVLGATGITQYTFNSATNIIGATGPAGSVGATGFMINIPMHKLSTATRLTYNNNANANLTGLVSGNSYYAIVVDSDNIQLANNYTTAISGATGATGFIFISKGTGDHKVHPQNDLYKNFNLIISSGNGVNSVLNIKEYDEITNTIHCYGYPSGTITANNSTYFVYPDLYAFPGGATGPTGANYNDDHYGGSILSLSISSGGIGYSTANTISFEGGYGIGAAATITSVGITGAITGISLTSNGRGYIYDPNIRFSPGATGIVGTGADIRLVSSPLNSAVEITPITRNSMFGHYQYYVNTSSISTNCSTVIGLDRITLTNDSFDTNNLYVGQSISGSGITANSRIRNISGRNIDLDKPASDTTSSSKTFSGKPQPIFEYGETLVQQSSLLVNSTVFNKMRVIKYDRINKILYVEKDEESDELNNVNNLTRSKNNSTINIIGSTGFEIYSGWKSINQPIGCIIKSYPL